MMMASQSSMASDLGVDKASTGADKLALLSDLETEQQVGIGFFGAEQRWKVCQLIGFHPSLFGKYTKHIS